MDRWKVITIILLLSFACFLIGNSRNDVLEIHNNGAAMCLNCVGLE
jgi:hypothetical protein